MSSSAQPQLGGQFTPTQMNLRSGAALGGSPEPDPTGGLALATSGLSPVIHTGGSAARIPTVHGLDTDSIYAAVDTSMRDTAMSLPTATVVDLESVRLALTELVSATQLDPTVAANAIMGLSAHATTQNTGRDALAKMASASKSILNSVVAAHNADLHTTEGQVRDLESHLSSVIQTGRDSELSLLAENEVHKRERDGLRLERDALMSAPAELSCLADREAASMKSHAAKMHRCWSRLDPLVQSKAMQVQRERRLISAQLTMLQKANASADLDTDPDVSLTEIITGDGEQEKVDKAIKTIAKSISHIDATIDGILSEEYNLPVASTVKAEAKLHLSADLWGKAINQVYQTRPDREKGLRYVTTIAQLLMCFPRQLFTLFGPWMRILGEYNATTTGSDYLVPSRYQLDRGEPGKEMQPRWIDHGTVICNEGEHKYSPEFSRLYESQNKLLYGILSRLNMGAADEARAGSAHGRYGSNRVVYRALEGESLALLYFYAQRMRQISYATVAQHEQELSNFYIILVKEADILKGLRAWRTLASRGLKLHLRIKYSAMIWRCCQVIKSKSPVELGPIVSKYLTHPPPLYEEDSLPLVHQICSDCESQLEGFNLLMNGKGSEPTIRARRADMAQSWGMSNARPSGPRKRAAGGNHTRVKVEGDSRIVCSQPHCSKKVPNKAIPQGHKAGDAVNLKCYECWQRTKPKKGGRTRAMAADTRQRAQFQSHGKQQHGGQRRDRARDGQGRGRGRGGAPRGRDAPAWMERRQPTHSRAMTAHVQPGRARHSDGWTPASGSNAVPVGTRAQRDGYLCDTRLYMVRILRSDETMLETLQDNVCCPFQDSRTLLTCPQRPEMCKDVRCGRAMANLAQSGSCLMTILCDTGASSSIFSGSIDGFLQGARPSDSKITGFDASASPVHAGMRGTLAIYAMQTKHHTLADVGEYHSQKGELLRMEVDTVPGMVDSLLSYSDLHLQGWNLRIVAAAGKKECSIERTDPLNGKSRTIPLYYDNSRRGFVAYVCVGRNSGLVHRRGRATEKKLQALSLSKGSAATLSDLGYGYTTGKPPYAVDGADLSAAAAAIEHILPDAVHISTEVNGEQCYGSANTLTRQPLQDERAGNGPNLVFTPPKGGQREEQLSPVAETADAPSDDDAVDLHHLLHCSEHAKDNYLYMADNALHPYERARRERERHDDGEDRVQTHARAARMTTEGPLGFAQVSGARSLAEPAEGSPDGTDLANALNISSSSSGAGDGDPPQPRYPTYGAYHPSEYSDAEDDEPAPAPDAAPRTPGKRAARSPERRRKPRPQGLLQGNKDLPAHDALLHNARLTADARAQIAAARPRDAGRHAPASPRKRTAAQAAAHADALAAGQSTPANKQEQRDQWSAAPHRPSMSDADREAIARALADSPEEALTRADARGASPGAQGSGVRAPHSSPAAAAAPPSAAALQRAAGGEHLPARRDTVSAEDRAAIARAQAEDGPRSSRAPHGRAPAAAAGSPPRAYAGRHAPRTRAQALSGGGRVQGRGGKLPRSETEKGVLRVPRVPRVPSTASGIGSAKCGISATGSAAGTAAGTHGSTTGTRSVLPSGTEAGTRPHMGGAKQGATHSRRAAPALPRTASRRVHQDARHDDHDQEIVANAANSHATFQTRQSPLPQSVDAADFTARPEPEFYMARAAPLQAAAMAAEAQANPDGDAHDPESGIPRSSPSDEPTGTDLDDFIEDYDCPGITGTKRTLNAREQRQTTAHLHRRYGHIGHSGDSSGCALCQMMGGSFHRRGHKRSKVPADPELPGYRWAVDILFMTTPAISGEMYACVMRDCCSGFYVVTYDKTKSFGRHIVSTIKSMRARPHFQGFSYPIFSELRSDHDGSWFLEAETQRELDELGVTCIFSGATSTDTSRANAFAEAAVKFITHTTKMILLQNRLPTSFWKWAMDQAVQIRNLFPLRKYANNVYSGDAMRPLEQITRSRVSRLDCNQILSALCPVGSLNLVHQSQLNSTDLGTPTARWGICIGNMGKVSIFFCPYAGARSARFYSRNWMGIELPAGLGYHAALNIKPGEDEVAPPGVTIPPCDRDLKLKNIISIPNLSALTAAQRRVWSPIVSLKTGKMNEGNTPSIIMINDEGVVYAHDADGNITRTDQVLTLEQRTAPNTSIVNHLHDSGINIPRSLDPHRTFDPVVLMTAPASMIGQTFWMHYPNHGYWLATIRLYDPSAKLWTATFRDGTFLDLHMRELELLMVDRPDDPKVEGMDMTSGVGLDIQERAAEGPDLHGPLPEKLLEELCDDLGDDALLSEDGDPIPWSSYTVTAIQAALENPARLVREGVDQDSGPATYQRTSPPRSTPGRSRRQQARPARVGARSPIHMNVRFQVKAPVPKGSFSRKMNSYFGLDKVAHDSHAERLVHRAAHRGRTGRTRGLNPVARLEADIAAKRHKPDSDAEVPYPAADNDGLPWADTIFNWSGNGLPPPKLGVTPYFEINFEEWVLEGHATVTSQDETFQQLCGRLDLDTKQSKLYWMWLGKYYGPSVGARTESSVCSRQMPCPWGRTQRGSLLMNGQVFPVPKGRLWKQLLQQQILKDNGGNTEHESVRISRAFLTAIEAHERQQDAITRATTDKATLQDVTLFMTDHSVHEQDDDKKGTQLRAMMAKLGTASSFKRMAPTFATLGLIASIASGNSGGMDPRGHHPEAAWIDHQKENKIHLDVNEHGLIQVYSNNATKHDDSIRCFKAKKSVQDAAKRGEDPINPLTGRIRPPKSIKDIAGRPDEALWRAAIKEEVASLESMGVFHNDLTLDQCRKMGVTTSPVPLMITFDAKHTPLGTFDRAKARICVAGSPHWMKAGIHYGLTFAATPAHEITRVLMALCVARGYARFQWDIKSAFMSTPIKPQDRIILRYPKGAERWDAQGRPLFAILDKVLYGVPSASRKFGQYLRKWILKRFNETGFSVKSSRSEPCLYIIANKEKRTSYLSIFTDDCQIVGPNINDLKEIGEIFATKFEIKICDSQELLGVRRVIKKESDGSTSLYMTQPGFIDSTCKEFAPQYEELFGKRKMVTPFPPREMLTRKEIPEDPVTAKREHALYSKQGSMSMTGCILWAARNTMPELSYGVSQLCRMMSTPTEKSYNFALHMVSYMSTQVSRGIRYNSKGNHQLIGHYDSSLKPDPADSKCQFGYVFYWMNGPICWASRKHNHVSLSTTQAEYQALAHCARAAVWLRTMFKEMGLPEYVQGPTILLGDCINANSLAKEDKVTAQNRHILMSYHYAKEMVELGEICPRRVTTKLNTSDLLTKANPRPDLDRLVPVLTGLGGELPPIPDLPRD